MHIMAVYCRMLFITSYTARREALKLGLRIISINILKPSCGQIMTLQWYAGMSGMSLEIKINAICYLYYKVIYIV